MRTLLLGVAVLAADGDAAAADRLRDRREQGNGGQMSMSKRAGGAASQRSPIARRAPAHPRAARSSSSCPRSICVSSFSLPVGLLRTLTSRRPLEPRLLSRRRPAGPTPTSGRCDRRAVSSTSLLARVCLDRVCETGRCGHSVGLSLRTWSPTIMPSGAARAARSSPVSPSTSVPTSQSAPACADKVGIGSVDDRREASAQLYHHLGHERTSSDKSEAKPARIPV